MIKELTLGNLRSYADASETLALKLLDLELAGFDDLVVPSRGAAPFERWASAYFHGVWKRALKTSEERIDAAKARVRGPMVNPLYLPFTADLGDGTMGVDSRDVRRFWTAVLAAMTRGEYQDPYYRFFDFLRATVCHAPAHAHDYRALSPRLVFLDTVVSGRAVCEIMDAFDEFGLEECHFIFIVDARGERLRRPYARQIDAAVQSGRATRIDVDRLFTEDQGPAVSGIWSVVMPEVMEVARNEIPEFRRSGAIGAGVYYTEVRARDDASNMNATVAISNLAGLVPMLWNEYIQEDWIEHELDRLRDHLDDTKIIDPMQTLIMARPRLVTAAKVPFSLGVSSSHALRMHVTRDVAAARLAGLGNWTSPLEVGRR